MCWYDVCFLSQRSFYYDIGDTISISDQEMSHEIFYGEYVDDMYKIADANYIINGGNKQITIMKLSAAW